MEAEMFENPHIIYIISKMKHEELLAECQMIQLVNAARKTKKKNKSYSGRFLLFVADLLIKFGLSLKRRLAQEEETFNNIYVPSNED
jgi:hypothetical protein